MGERSSEQLTRYFYLSDSDRSVIAEHRGPHNRLGSGLQLICAGSSGHPFLQQENREEDSLVGRGALQACCQWQPQLSKQRGFLPLMVPRECVLDNPLHCQQGRRKRSAQDPRGVLGMSFSSSLALKEEGCVAHTHGGSGWVGSHALAQRGCHWKQAQKESCL